MFSLLRPGKPAVDQAGHNHQRQERDVAPVRDHHQQSGRGFFHGITASSPAFRSESSCVDWIVPAITKTTLTQVHMSAAAHCWSARTESPEWCGVQRYTGYATRSEKTSMPDRTSQGK